MRKEVSEAFEVQETKDVTVGQGAGEGQEERHPQLTSEADRRLDRGGETEEEVGERSGSEWELDASEVEEMCFEEVDRGRSPQSLKKEADWCRRRKSARHRRVRQKLQTCRESAKTPSHCDAESSDRAPQFEAESSKLAPHSTARSRAWRAARTCRGGGEH